MPPAPGQEAQRAQAVRGILRYVRDALDKGARAELAIGLAPEGSDMPEGVISLPPEGTGRFVQLLVEQGLEIAPVAIYLEHGQLCLHFGRRYRPDIPTGLDRRATDLYLRRLVMQEIANLAPPAIRGEFINPGLQDVRLAV
jgi:hypothetical protein